MKKQYALPDKYNPAKWVPLDMSQCTIDGEVTGHPELNDKDTFLCLIGKQYFKGKFSKQWYGWNFKNWIEGTVGLQFDPPGTNSSDWQAIWKFVK